VGVAVSLLLDSNTAATGEKTETHVENHLQPRNRKPEKVYNSMGFNCLCSKTASVIMRRRNGLAPLETKIPNRTTKRFLTGFTLKQGKGTGTSGYLQVEPAPVRPGDADVFRQ